MLFTTPPQIPKTNKRCNFWYPTPRWQEFGLCVMAEYTLKLVPLPAYVECTNIHHLHEGRTFITEHYKVLFDQTEELLAMPSLLIYTTVLWQKWKKSSLTEIKQFLPQLTFQELHLPICPVEVVWFAISILKMHWF